MSPAAKSEVKRMFSQAIGVEVEQDTSAPPPKKNPGSAPVKDNVDRSSQVYFLDSNSVAVELLPSCSVFQAQIKTCWR